MTFAKRLRNAREAAGLNQTELAKRLKVTPQSVQLWESEGETATTPRAKRVKEIASALGVREEWLLLGKEHDASPPTPRWVREVPLLSPNAAEAWASERRVSAQAARVFCPTPCSPATFAVQVTSGHGLPDLLPGDTIFIDPEAPALEGGIVLAKTPNEQSTKFLAHKSTNSRMIIGAAVYLGRYLKTYNSQTK